MESIWNMGGTVKTSLDALVQVLEPSPFLSQPQKAIMESGQRMQNHFQPFIYHLHFIHPVIFLFYVHLHHLLFHLFNIAPNVLPIIFISLIVLIPILILILFNLIITHLNNLELIFILKHILTLTGNLTPGFLISATPSRPWDGSVPIDTIFCFCSSYYLILCFVLHGCIFEDFTLPHRFLVLPPGIHMDSWSPPGVHVEFLWQGAQPNCCLFPPGFHLDSTWIPDGLHGLHLESVESTPFHITLHSNFHLSVDSSSLYNIFCRYWFINKNQVT